MDLEKNQIIGSIEELIRWLNVNGYSGWDIYDGLNSPITKKVNNRYIRILLLQMNKYSPINCRPILKIEKGIDLKGTALIAQAYAKYYQITAENWCLEKLAYLIEYINDNSLYQDYDYHCWASHYYPYLSSDGTELNSGSPDIIGTSQAIIALSETYSITKDQSIKKILNSASNGLVHLFYQDNDNLPFFRYNLQESSKKAIIINASAQAVEALSHYLKVTDDNCIRAVCDNAIQTIIKLQNNDGSWRYSTDLFGKAQEIQLDFHQGYILDGMHAYLHLSGSSADLVSSIHSGSEYYISKQFRKGKMSYYRYPLPFPIDIHNQAQGVITFSKLLDLDRKYIQMAKEILLWTINNMQDKSGYFYYQKWPCFTNRIPYIRWGQAWMLLALSTYLSTQSTRTYELQ